MLKKEITDHSPWRIIEKATHGGVKPGEIGALVGTKGVGKTACLVHLATYNLIWKSPLYTFPMPGGLIISLLGMRIFFVKLPAAGIFLTSRPKKCWHR